MKRGGGTPLKSLCLVISLSSAVIVFLLTPFLHHNNWQLQLTVATISGNDVPGTLAIQFLFKSECCDLVLVVLVVCSSGSSANDATLPAPVALPARPVTVVLVVVVVPVVVVQVLCQLDLSQSGAASLCSATLACSTHWSL